MKILIEKVLQLRHSNINEGQNDSYRGLGTLNVSKGKKIKKCLQKLERFDQYPFQFYRFLQNLFTN